MSQFLPVSPYLCLFLSDLVLVEPCPRALIYVNNCLYPISNLTLSTVITLAEEVHPHSFLKSLPLPDLPLKPVFTAWGYTNLSLLGLKILQIYYSMTVSMRNVSRNHSTWAEQSSVC